MTSKRKISYQLTHAAWQAVDLLFPPVCMGCGTLGERFCPDCVARSVRLPEQRCVLCGGQHASGAKDCQRVTWLDQVSAWGWHKDPLRKAVLGLKYQANLAMGDALCQLLFPMVRPWRNQLDPVVPVPLSRERKQERGYNQAALLARPLASGIDLPYRPSALRRVRDTESQVGKTLHERRENVGGAFLAEGSLVKGKQILLVDDVLTTGSTLDAAAEALKAAGAARVSAVVVSRAE